MMVMISAAEGPPDEEGRAAIQASYAGMKHSVRAGVLVVEGEGFAASAKRSIITLMTMSGAQPFPMKVAGNVLEGTQKIVTMLGAALAPGLNAQTLAAAAFSARTIGQ